MGPGRLIALALAICISSSARAELCPLAGQKPMVMIELFFGERIGTAGRVGAAQWDSFARGTLTPHFPQGFTLYDAHGQWLDSLHKRVVREPTKIVVIAVEAFKDFHADVDAVTQVYEKRFHQQSVGILTTQACGAF